MLPEESGRLRALVPGALRGERSRVGARPQCVGARETRMVFSPGWSLPGGTAWHAPLPADDEEGWEHWNDWRPKGILKMTNWIYVLLHEADLPENRLDRAVVTISNC